MDARFTKAKQNSIDEIDQRSRAETEPEHSFENHEGEIYAFN